MNLVRAVFPSQITLISFLLFIVCCGHVQTACSAEPYSLPKFSKLTDKHIDITALVVDLTRGRILAKYNPDTRLTPASVSKLYIDAAALDYWGPNHRFHTRLYSNGEIKGNTLDGDLLLLGAGDPEFTANRLWLLVTRLQQRDIQTITGNIIINNGLFGPVPCDNKDRCEAREVATNGYDSPLSAAGLGYSAVEITIFPGTKIGSDARIELLPPGLREFEIDGKITTTSSKRRPLYGVRRISREGKQILNPYGRVPLGGGPFKVYRSVADPARHTGQVLLSLLEAANIKVNGRLQVRSSKMDKDFKRLESIQSAELSQILRSMMTFSNNYMADVLTLGLAARDERTGNLQLTTAAEKLENFAVRANLAAPDWLQAAEKIKARPVIEGGSGLNPANKLSARDVVALLAYMHERAELFPAYVGTLSVPRYVSSRMLRRWANKDWKERIAVKTGYLSEPRSAIGVGGYFRLKNGGWGAFACLVNGTRKRRNISSSTAIGSCREDMQKIMAEM